MIIFVILFVLILFYFHNNKENFNSLGNNNIDYYVIHMKNKKKRHNNIIKNEKKLKHKINIFNAVNGKNIDLNNLQKYDKNLKLNCKFNNSGELGCYLSHYLLIKKAAKS
jgi:GR25 family glycosyltransferase involved in LPS biosynthesis